MEEKTVCLGILIMNEYLQKYGQVPEKPKYLWFTSLLIPQKLVFAENRNRKEVTPN